MKDLLERALDTACARGATYADARYVATEVQTVSVKDNRVEAVTFHVSRGIGLRVIANGAWGFSATSRLAPREMDTLAGTAVRRALASSSGHGDPGALGDPLKIVEWFSI